MYDCDHTDIQIEQAEDASSAQPFHVFLKDGRTFAVKAYTFILQPGTDLVQFYKSYGVPNTQLFLRSSQISCIVPSSDLAEVPAFIEMQSMFTKIIERLDRIEQAVF